MYMYMCTVHVHVLCSVNVHIHVVITRLSGCFHTTAMDTSPFVHVHVDKHLCISPYINVQVDIYDPLLSLG